MGVLLFLFGTALAAGLYFVLADLLKIPRPVSYTHLRAHETGRNLVCRLLLEKKKKKKKKKQIPIKKKKQSR